MFISTHNLFFVLAGLCLIIWLLTLRKGGGDLEKDIKGAQSGYSPELSAPEAYVRKKAAQQRGELLEAKVIEQKNRYEMHHLPEREAELREAEAKAHDLLLKTHDVNMQVADQALGHGVDATVYLEKKKHQFLSEQERINEQNRAIDEIRMTIIAKWLQDHGRMVEIQLLIDNALIEIAQLHKGFLKDVQIDLSVIPRMIASREESIATWEGNKRGIQQRLLKDDNGSNLERINEEAEHTRDS